MYLSSIAAYLQIIAINIVLSGDNVVVISLAAATLQPKLRAKAIFAGIAAATVIRVAFALIATRLLAFTGLLVAGGLLLLWVCWKMFLELRHGEEEARALEELSARDGMPPPPGKEKTLGQAVIQIVVADVSMSLDNVLAVAGAARQNWMALVFGLALSVALMGLAASLIARLLAAYRWIAWVGLAIITYVALSMLYSGAHDLASSGLPQFGSFRLAPPAAGPGQ
ncbi:MAG TPA: YjbE family putative metal transport protein [Bauldia sp.]|nr:YjbE family putative metal transport protein [Bauldia sp.]